VQPRTIVNRVQLLIAFGSYVAGAERPNDIDVGCSLIARFDGSKQRELEDQRRRNKGRFANTSEWAIWPKLEVLKALKSGARGLSVQEVGGWDLEKIDHVVIFSDYKAPRAGEASGRMPASSTGYAEFLWLNPGFHHDQIPKIQHVNCSALIPVSSSGLGAALSSFDNGANPPL
jgi:hypothetical protein